MACKDIFIGSVFTKSERLSILKRYNFIMEAAKLTLSLDKEVIERAKHIAKSKGISLSKYIQGFLEKSIENESLKDELDGNIPQEIKALRGILKGGDISKKQLREMKYEYLKEKYDL